MIRNARRSDLTAVVGVMNAVDVATLGEPDTSEEDVASGWEETGFDVETDAFVAEDDEVVGYAELYGREEQMFDLDLYVHPHADQDLAAALLDAALERAATRAPTGSVLATWLPVGDARLQAYAAAGFTPARQFVRMRHAADGVPNEPEAPAGITLRTFDRDADAAGVHAVMVDAFAHHVRPMTPSLETFTERHLDHPDFDARFWGVAEDDGTIVGAISAFNHGDIGFIRHIGVPDAYRGRGIGSALVRRAIRLLAEAGQSRVDLGVDVEDDVGAARLYETLGFATVQRLELVERRL